jgi:hypothetical protein
MVAAFSRDASTGQGFEVHNTSGGFSLGRKKLAMG